jgi:redox-sensitive bicupin YhaK (pirin superfamily)
MTPTNHPSAVESVIVPRAHDVGGFEVHRALPAEEKQMIGTFIFFDQMGPREFLTGKGLDVRLHPYIGLATVTYLFDGLIMHRDSLGTQLSIVPGEKSRPATPPWSPAPSSASSCRTQHSSSTGA